MTCNKSDNHRKGKYPFCKTITNIQIIQFMSDFVWYIRLALLKRQLIHEPKLSVWLLCQIFCPEVSLYCRYFFMSFVFAINDLSGILDTTDTDSSVLKPWRLASFLCQNSPTAYLCNTWTVPYRWSNKLGNL